MNQERSYLQRIHEAYPDLMVKTARLHTRDGQFSDILFVDEELIFRFPRSPHVAKAMAFEMAILSRLQRHMSLPIPNPVYHRADPQTGDLIFKRIIHAADRTRRPAPGADAASRPLLPEHVRAAAGSGRAARQRSRVI